jgi:hypothetical protein
MWEPEGLVIDSGPVGGATMRTTWWSMGKRGHLSESNQYSVAWNKQPNLASRDVLVVSSPSLKRVRVFRRLTASRSGTYGFAVAVSIISRIR